MQPAGKKSYAWIWRVFAVLSVAYLLFHINVTQPAYVEQHNAAIRATPIGGTFPDDSGQEALVFYIAPLTSVVLAITFSVLAFRSARKVQASKVAKASNYVVLILVLCIVVPFILFVIGVMMI